MEAARLPIHRPRKPDLHRSGPLRHGFLFGHDYGHGTAAALIAAAGFVLGNGLISLPLSRIGYKRAVKSRRYGWALFAYWCTVASIGNFLDYVPIRTFTRDGDMGSMQRGLGWSPWMILLVLGIPTALVLIWLLARIMPATLRQLFPNSLPQRTTITILTPCATFGFYGAAGLLEGGPISHHPSAISVLIILPLTILAETVHLHRSHRRGLS
ncbi:hypothetical protein [Gluconacetobacter takamatsuzukensis]|uniref:Uncharacterized protein n=1 Tax=Gluconacetobacter takamatsuzukensis TaxID=1286190 RepID=A0A7W4PRL2_9PROT|nr:hypothetical protein [Gluconacetobacter takamatsuzukensis]MBB2205599.1 hypothetical protein [Gluconacetobacter takamatsuzukensis]